jgi:transcriptional regulator
MQDRRPRSEKYQWRLLEKNMDFTEGLPLSWDQSKGLYSSISEIDKEALYTANDKAMEVMFKVAAPTLTARQAEVMQMMKSGMTQMEVRTATGMTKGSNSTIAKCLKGNTDYNNGAKQYGGVQKKIKVVCLKSDEYRKAILELHKLELGGMMIRITRSWFHSPEEFYAWLYDDIDDRIGLPFSILDQMHNIIIKYWINTNKMPNKILPKAVKETKLTKYENWQIVNELYFDYIREAVNLERAETLPEFIVSPMTTKERKKQVKGFTKHQLKELKQLREDGHSLQTIANFYHTTTHFIKQLLQIIGN